MIFTTILILFSFYMVLKNRISFSLATTVVGVLAFNFIFLGIAKKISLFYQLQFLLLGFTLATTWSSYYLLKLQRKFIKLPLFIIPILIFCGLMTSKVLFSKMGFMLTLAGALVGLISEFLFETPEGFQSNEEFNHFKSFISSQRKKIDLLVTLTTKNPSNFYTTREYFQFLLKHKSDSTPIDLKKSLVNIAFYWTQQKSFSSLHPLVPLFNSLDFTYFKKNLVIFDLSDNDIERIHNMFRTGCWKIGLFVLDQYLISNKQSTKYTSTLVFSDRFLNDLKKISFDDESIELWLLKYSEQFKGTPISQKIILVFHNKEDWFNRNVRHAVV